MFCFQHLRTKGGRHEQAHPHIKTLRAHNNWRRGDERMKMGDPKEIGIALDWAIKEGS